MRRNLLPATLLAGFALGAFRRGGAPRAAMPRDRNAGWFDAPEYDPNEPGISRQQRRWRERRRAKRNRRHS